MPNDEFKKLLELLDENETGAIQKYECIYQSLLTLFGKQSDVYDPKQLADETIDRVLLNISKEKPIVLEKDREGAYFIGVAKNVLSEYRRDRKKLILVDLLPHKDPSFDPTKEQQTIEAGLNRERLLECRSQCLEKLSEAGRGLIIEYYRGHTGRKAGAGSRMKIRSKLAKSLSISLNALQIRVRRIKERLEECVNECLKKSADDSVQ